jgi:phospholipid/cholesterol/gamma-HCH transport system substrate-binding protein
MRRVAVIMLTLALAGALAVLARGSSAQGSTSARFDVIFDDARGLVGGQVVKIAGARAGSIDDVVVTPDFKARVEATVDARFMPFHGDATCTIRPEGLIAENYIDCDPGTPSSPPLRSTSTKPPTVPVARTTEPVSLLDLFNMFNLPTRERFTAIVSELGIGTAARGQDFNEILRRANPTLALARQVISILDRQRAQLAAAVDATHTIAAEAASHTGAVQRFLDRAAALTTLTAAHRDALSQGVARLPALLAAAQPTLSKLDVVARDGIPLVRQLHAAVPGLTRVQNDFGPFVAAARPALARLSQTLKRATPAVRDTTPLIKTVRSYTDRSKPGTLLFARLASNLQQAGFVENFLSVTYYIAASLARFDGNSHLLSILLVGAQNGACSVYATKPVAGCSAHYGSQPAFSPVRARAGTRGTPRASGCSGGQRRCAPGVPARPRGPHGAPVGSTPSTPAAASPAPSSPAPPAQSSSGPSSPAPPSLPPVPTGAVQQTVKSLQGLVNYLIK